MQLADLPSRRTETWKWSDLRAAMAGQEAVLIGTGAMLAEGPIAAFAEMLGDGYGPSELVIAGQDETFETRMSEGDAGQFGSVTLKAGASATLLERIAVTGSRLRPFLPAHARITLEPGATLKRIVVQTNAADAVDAALVLNEAVVTLGAGATFRQFVLGQGARLARIETSVTAAEGATIEMNAAYLAASRRHVDLTSRVTHAAPGVNTRQLVRGVARKGGRGVFQGKFLVERAGQKADAAMQHNALLLGEGAEVFAKPELEIYADDVACAHGNTAGQIDEDAVLYLRQRGLPDDEARAMITRAFLFEALPSWLDEPLRGEIEGRIDAWLRASS